MKKKPPPLRRPATKAQSLGPARSRKPAGRRQIGMETILVPIDFSPASLYPIQWAKFIAQRTRASIHFVSVHDFAYPIATALMPPVIGPEAEIRDQLHRDLQMVAISQKVLQASFHVRTGRPFDQICQTASEIQADLIVLATHGRTGWERAFLGRTVERVIRHAPCPVLVARQIRAGRKRALQLRKIVVPVDFSDCAAQGLHYAVGLAQRFGAELSLINAVQLHHDLPPVVIFSASKLTRWAREIAAARMEDLVGATDFGGVKFETAIKMGSPAQKVCRYAKSVGADLIVTSTHGRTGLSHILIGSTAEQIVRYARFPVLVVPIRNQVNGAQAGKQRR
jgi:nucleotide-binding universal stress UspA family protein